MQIINKGGINIQELYFALSNAAIIVISLMLVGGLASMIRTFSIRTYTRAFSGRFAKFVDNRLTFIGVIHHELSHALLAFLTGAKIKSCKLFKMENNTLGHVDIVPRGPFIIRLLQQAMCGIAPVLCGGITLYVIYYFGFYKRGTFDYVSIILILLAMCISYHMSMSKQDFKVARAGLLVAYIILVGLSFVINIDYRIYLDYIIKVIAILGINMLIALLARLIALIRN